MTRALAHRGPDGEGFRIEPGCGLGHRRLSLVDLEGGGQPLANEDGTIWLVANAEIYNHVELRERLGARGHRFATATDVEVILHLYEEAGDACVEPLVGMFAFALWDAGRRRLLLARDRFGVKPLYYTTLSDRTLLFASELKAILCANGVDRSLDFPALHQYFRLLTLPEPSSIFRDVRKLPAGHVLSWHDGECRERRYWSLPEAEGPDDVGSEREVIERLGAALEASVALTLRADAPLGVFLSGGVDSSLLTWLATASRSAPLPTFSAFFAEKGFDESPFSRRVADTFGTRHHSLVVTAEEAAAAFQRLVPHLDEPFADASCIPTFLLACHAREHVKGVLTGEGADELFAGSPWHTTDASDVDDILTPKAKAIFTEEQLSAVYSEDVRSTMTGVAWAPPPATAAALGRCRDGLDRRLCADLHVYLPSDLLAKADRMTMLASLEARVPFLNHPFAELAWHLPAGLRVRDGVRKYALKALGRGHLPAEVLERPKQGFGIPMDLWLWRPGPFRDMVGDVLLDDRTRRRGLFAEETVKAMWDAHDRLEALHGYRLWTLFVFELWQRHFVDGRVSAAA